MRGHPAGPRRRSRRREAFAVPSVALILLAPGASTAAPGAGEPSPGEALHRVVEDAAERLVLEIDVPALALDSNRVRCQGCLRATLPGAPDIPEWRFLVATGPGEPSLDFAVSGGETVLEAPGGVAPVPHEPSPRRAEYRPDPGLYAAAAGLRPVLLGPSLFRGAMVREVVVPLARLDPGGMRVLAPRRIMVTIGFGPPPVAPGAGPDPLVVSAVANPAGAVRLAARRALGRPARPARTAKAAWSEPSRRVLPEDLGESFIRILIGDRIPAALDEDRYYAIPFETLSATLPRVLDGAVRIRDLRLYTGGRDSLPLVVEADSAEPSLASPGTLREIPLEVVDDGDSTFDAGDTLKFFGHGTSWWKRLTEGPGPLRYEFHLDLSAFQNGYWLGFSPEAAGAPLRISKPDASAPEGPFRTSVRDYFRAEREAASGACATDEFDRESGHGWYWHWRGGCKTGTPEVTLVGAVLAPEQAADFRDVVPTGGEPDAEGLLGIYAYAADSSDSYRVHAGGSVHARGYLGGLGTSGAWYAWDPPGEAGSAALPIDSLVWLGAGRRLEGYTLSFRRRLVLRDRPLHILPGQAGGRMAFRVEGGRGARCLRIVDGTATALIRLDGEGRFADDTPPGTDVRYLVFRDDTRLEESALAVESLPAKGGAIRDLATGDGEDPEYLILAPRALLAEALALRDYRRDPRRARPYRAAVAVVEDVYRHFSSGRPAPAGIRNFLRRALSAWGPEGTSSLRHVLLFGDGHYDYRGILAAGRAEAPRNHVPPFEQPSAGAQTSTDDFYGWLDAGEGWTGSYLDIALGRLPVHSTAQARAYLDKLRAHEDPAGAGDWRARVVLAADDYHQGRKVDLLARDHLPDAEALGAILDSAGPHLAVEKLYLHDYPMNARFLKPQAAQDLLAQVNRGTLAVHFVGHGSHSQLADELLLQTSDVRARFRNEGRLPLFCAFACTVGKFDGFEESLGEALVTADGVGSIAAIAGTRESYPTPNARLAASFYSLAFRSDAGGKARTLGEALLMAKMVRGLHGDHLNDSKYLLLGEPVLALVRPGLRPSFTSVPDTLRALGCGNLEGTVSGGSGRGHVKLRIVAGSVSRSYPLPTGADSQTAVRRGGVLFESTVPYEGGAFSTPYFLPRKVPFGDSTARITAFAWDAGREMEGGAAALDLSIRGTSDQGCADDADGRGPGIRISGCEARETGEMDFPDRVRLSLPYCLQATVTDSGGGVLSGEGPDEGTTFEVPGVLEPFTPVPGTDELFRKTYRFTLESRDFRPGPHMLRVTARDGHGNLSTRVLRIDVAADTSLSTIAAYNVPNPVKRGGTTFHFSALMPSEEAGLVDAADTARLAFEIRIHDQRGRLVRRIREAVSGRTRWDGRDGWGRRLANGVYYFTVTARWSRDDPSRPGRRSASTRRNALILSR